MQVLRKAFNQPLDAAIAALVTSIKEDQEFILVDLAGSMAHCAMLAEQGLISTEQAETIQAGLKTIEESTKLGEFELKPEFEDVHMNVEKQLETLVGEPALRLHTARSRNDQVALDFRLYVIEAVDGIGVLLERLQQSLLHKAAEYPHTVMPGYTHLQRAQPVLFSHALLAFFEMLKRDSTRLQNAKTQAMICPLGAGAQAGTSLSTNPEFTAAQLGLSGSFANSIDAVMDRDFAADLLFAASLCSIHLSQLCETLIIWNTSEFGFVRFSDAVTTSSSLMPQKKNPDPVEIVRGKSGLAIGELVNLLTTLKGLPLGYNRDLQETKSPVIRVVKSLAACLQGMQVVIDNMQVRVEQMLHAASDPNLMATDLVEFLVLKGVPFRQAHEAVAQAVQLSAANNCLLSDLTLSDWRRFCPAFDQDLYLQFEPLKSAQAKRSAGGTGLADQQVKLLLSQFNQGAI